MQFLCQVGSPVRLKPTGIVPLPAPFGTSRPKKAHAKKPQSALQQGSASTSNGSECTKLNQNRTILVNKTSAHQFGAILQAKRQ